MFCHNTNSDYIKRPLTIINFDYSNCEVFKRRWVDLLYSCEGKPDQEVYTFAPLLGPLCHFGDGWDRNFSARWQQIKQRTGWLPHELFKTFRCDEHFVIHY